MRALLLLRLTTIVGPASGNEVPGGSGVSFFVSASAGDDEASGTGAAPFQTLARCAAAMTAAQAPASCEVAAGTYRESVALPTHAPHPLSFHAAPDSSPVLSGLVPLPNLNWTKREAKAPACVFVADLETTSFQQLFYRGQAMIEARWPNVDIHNFEAQILDKTVAWQPTDKGSLYGHIADPALAKCPFSWDGALATLQVAHQFFTWTRKVENHTVGSGSFDYAQDLPGLAEWSQPRKCWNVNTTHETCNQNWAGNQYFLSGKLEALDAKGEWFLQDSAQGGQRLHFFPPDGCVAPPAGTIEVKTRDYVLKQPPTTAEQCSAKALRPLQLGLKGLALHGATLSLSCCHGCVLENLELTYPTYNREILGARISRQNLEKELK
jgi:hypothetical protein